MTITNYYIGAINEGGKIEESEKEVGLTDPTALEYISNKLL